MLRMLVFILYLCLLLRGYTGAGRSVGPPTCVGGGRPFLFSTENSHFVPTLHKRHHIASSTNQFPRSTCGIRRCLFVNWPYGLMFDAICPNNISVPSKLEALLHAVWVCHTGSSRMKSNAGAFPP